MELGQLTRATCAAVPRAHMHADAAFARTLADLNMDPDLLLADTPLAIPILFDHVLEERLLSGNISTEPTTVETFRYAFLPRSACRCTHTSLVR